MKTHQNLTNENLKTIILNCGWQVEKLEDKLWLLSIDIGYKSKFCFELELADVVLNTLIALIKYCKDYDIELYIEELIKEKGNKKYPTYKSMLEKSEIISWKLYKLALYLPKETAKEIDKINE